MAIFSWLYDVSVSSASEAVVIAARFLFKKIWLWVKSKPKAEPTTSKAVCLNLTYRVDLPVTVLNDQVELDIQLHTITVIRVRR